MIYDRNVPFTAGTYTIKVGKGGKGSSTPGNIIYGNHGDNDIALKRGENGLDSEIINSTGVVYYRATGGGGGLGGNTDYSVPSSLKPFPGGSGGGNGGKDGAFGGLLSTLNVVRGNIVPVLNNIESNSINPSYDSTVCFGNEGGIGGGDFPWLGSGGGGAGGRGTDVHNKSEATKNNDCGIGGIGKECNITGTNIFYAGGGGGGNWSGDQYYNDGGQGGGGRSGTNSIQPTKGTDGLGGGGGGDGNDIFGGADGGSGIVILKFSYLSSYVNAYATLKNYPKPWIIFKNDPAYYKKIDISSSEPNWNGNYDTVSPYSYMDVSTYLLNNFTGEYITIKLPQKIYLNKYILCSTIDKLNNAPQHFRIYGSLDGINWTQLVERQLTTSSYVNTLISNSTYSTGYYTDQETKSTVAYDYYGIVVNKLLGPLDASNNKLSFSLWNIYGTNDLKGKSYFEFGVVRDTSKTVGSSLNDGLIRTNNSNIFIKSGNANTAALTIGSNNKIAIGKNIANEVLDISGSLIASEFRIINQSYPIIDSSSNIYVSGNVDISGNLTLNNDKFVINSSNGNLLIGGTLDVSKNININNNKTIIDSSGNIKSQGNFDLSNNININNNVTIDTSGSMIINNTLDISNNATLRNNLDVKGNIKSNALTTNSAINKVSIRNTSVDPSYNFHVTGNTRLEGNLDVDGNIILVDTIQQTSEQFIINNDGNSVALIVNQIGAQPIIDLRDDDQSVFYLADNGLLGLGTTTPNYTVDVSGSCYIQQTLDVSGDLIIGGNTYFSESIQLNDILDISQNLNINDNFFIDPSGNIDICGNVLIYGYLISNGNNANSGGFQQEGDANINGNLRVLYNIDISQNLRVLDTFIIDTSGNIKSKDT